MKTKRRNIARWKENRLRRLDYKIQTGQTWREEVGYIPIGRPELDRCCDRAHQLAAEIRQRRGGLPEVTGGNQQTPNVPPLHS
jgi:hypothetical protein